MDYKKQAQEIADKIGITMTAEFVKHGKHFDDDKESRDIWKITLKKNDRQFSFNFGQSIAHSGEFIGHKNLCLNSKYRKRYFTAEEMRGPLRYEIKYLEIKKNPDYEIPDLYSVLTCLTKYDPGTFENFCAEYGYDEDSRRADKTYHAVVEEFRYMQILFSDSDLELLQEIQ